MDPITAIGFASSIITFVDFAWDLVSGTVELSKSQTGRSSQNIHIENVIRDLEEATDDLDTGSLGTSKEAKRLKRLAEDCHTLAEELLGLLKRLQRDGNKRKTWQSLVVTWRNMRKASEVSEMQERLQEYRSEISLQLQLMLK